MVTIVKWKNVRNVSNVSILYDVSNTNVVYIQRRKDTSLKRKRQRVQLFTYDNVESEKPKLHLVLISYSYSNLKVLSSSGPLVRLLFCFFQKHKIQSTLGFATYYQHGKLILLPHLKYLKFINCEFQLSFCGFE